jgi:hypothetical protein
MLKVSIAALALAFGQLALAGGDPYPTAACDQQLARDARLKMLDGKVALDFSGDAAPSMKRVPTLTERSVLGLWSQLRQECFALGGAHRAAAHADLPALAERMFAMQQQLVGELREGRIGFAEFNARRLELWQMARRRQAEIL